MTKPKKKPAKAREILDQSTQRLMAAVVKSLPVSAIIRDRILTHNKKAAKGKKVRFHANDNIAEFIQPGELQKLEDELTAQMGNVLRTLVIDVENDHNSEDTARRVAKMMLHETMSGRYTAPPKLTHFPDVVGLDQIYMVGPCKINSMCSHHHQNIIGEVYYGVFPSKRVIGLSKFHRVANWIMQRPQIQEEATFQLADYLEGVMKPKGLAVLVKAKHFCCGVRGVKDDGTWMVTSVMRGMFRDPTVKEEFLRLVDMAGGRR